MFLYIFLAMVAGAATVISGVLNSSLGKEIGMLQSAFVNFCAGLILALLYALYVKFFVADIQINYADIPPYLFLGGAIGFLICFLSNAVYQKVSAVLSTLLIFTGQMITGALIDIFVFDRSISIMKICGILLVGVGIIINLMIDKKIEKEQSLQ